MNTLQEFSKEAVEEWDGFFDLYVKERGIRIPDSVVRGSLKFVKNKEWIREALQNGHTIIDLGDPMGKHLSIFYDMEKSEILRYLKGALK